MKAIDPELVAVFVPEARSLLGRIAATSGAERVQAAHALAGAGAKSGLGELAADAETLENLLAVGDDASEAWRRVQAAVDALAGEPPPAGELLRQSAAPEWDPDELRDLRAFFLDEATEHLEALGEGLAELRAQPGAPAPLYSLLRKLHTLKGSAGSVGLDELGGRAHALEDRLIAWRDRGRPLEPHELDELEAALGLLARKVDAIKREVRAPAPAPPSAPQLERLVDRPAPDAQTVRVEVQRIDELMDAASELVFDRTRIDRRLQELDGCVRDVAKVRGALNAVLAELDRVPPSVAARVGEIATELSDVLASLERAAAGGAEDAEGLRRTSATLQEGIRRVRMMSVGRLFARLQPPVRELARREGKQVTLRTAGETTEIDKAVVERVAEPLLHLLRNAIAHGIEPPDERRRVGKAATGTITLSARHEGDATEIVVSDDGRGIDLDAVRAALVAARRASRDEAALYDTEALYATLFEPGVSTRVAADDLAGRGVGLDAVKDAISRLGGTVRVTSTPGRGASFVVKLPLTTAVQQALLFKVGGQVYAVPAARVQEATTISTEDLRLSPERERVIIRGRELPLVRLGVLLGVPAPPGLATRSALVLTAADETFAMTCDKVIGPREIVVRSLGPLLAGLPLYAGATISGAGKVQLILDVERLLAEARRGGRGSRPTRTLGPRRVLVVDDSRSIREAATLILQQGGYAVEAVPDGWDAWELLQDRPFDVLLTDLEMPRLDGYELIARVRRSPELRELPVVVVSSRTGDTTRGRILDGGADSFVPKPLRRRLLLDALDAALHAR